MMTRNDVKRIAGRHLQVNYCCAQYLLQLAGMKIGYNAGLYGWNYDVFIIGNAVITTGYRNMVGRDVTAGIRPFEEKAKQIMTDLPYNDWDGPKNALLEAFQAWVDSLD